MWASGNKEDSLNFMQQFSTNLAKDIKVEGSDRAQRPSVPKQKLNELSRLLARCYFKLGQWQMELTDNWGTVRVRMY